MKNLKLVNYNLSISSNTDYNPSILASYLFGASSIDNCFIVNSEINENISTICVGGIFVGCVSQNAMIDNCYVFLHP